MDSDEGRKSLSHTADRPLDRHASLKVNKTRRKGGFLLQNVFSKSRKSEDKERGEEQEPEDQRDAKGKRKLKDSSPDLRDSILTSDKPMTTSLTHESPLANVAIHHAKGSYDRHGHAHFNKERERHSSPSTSQPDSRMMRSSFDASVSSASTDAPAPAIDPTTIVNMALNLSENRRRNISGGQYLAPGVASGRRIVSPIGPASGSPGPWAAGGSLNKHIHQQRHGVRDRSPNNTRRAVSGRSDAPEQSEGVRSPPIDQDFGQPLQISAATLARADRARRYIELGADYRRALTYLLPLKPAPGSTVLQTISVPGSPHVMMQRIPTGLQERHELGRQYNPLQMIRNRKLRARSRNPLKPEAEEWDDTIKVSEWVDSVEQAAKDPQFHDEGKAYLPGYPPDSVPLGASLSLSNQHGGAPKIKKPRYDWHFTPAELLADAYWLEQDHNKDLIEDSHSRLIFPKRNGVAEPRKSVESRRSFQESVRGSLRRESRDAGEPLMRSSIDKGRSSLEVPRKSMDDRHGRVRHVINKARGRRDSSTSDLSHSDHDDLDPLPKKRSSAQLNRQNEYGHGALQLHMDHLIAQESQATSKSNPDLISPETPEKWGRLTTIKSGETPETAVNSNVASPVKRDDRQNGHLSPQKTILRSNTVAEAPESRQRYAGRAEYAHQDSYGFSSVPRSQPLPQEKRNSLAGIPSTPSSRDTSPVSQKYGFHRVNTDESRKLRIRRQDSDLRDSPIADQQGPARPSVELATPHKHKRHLFPIKTNDSTNSVDQGLHSSGGGRDMDEDAGTPKEPSSAVRRFFKGGRLGALVRNETSKVSDLLRRREGSQEAFDYASSGSTELLDDDTDGSYGSPPHKTRPYPLRRAPTSGTITEYKSNDALDGDQSPRFQNLPIFRRTSAKQDSDPSRPTTPDHDHIAAQQNVARRNRSPRFDGLKPPGLDLGRLSSRNSSVGGNNKTLSRTTTADDSALSRHASHASSKPETGRPRSPQRTNKLLQGVIDQDLGRGRSASLNPPVASPLPGGPVVSRRGSKSAQHQRRQWSISDGTRAVSRTSSRMRSPLPEDNDLSAHSFIGVSKYDIEHVRALLLSSGVRAASLLRIADQPRPEGPPPFLRESALASGKTISSTSEPKESNKIPTEPANKATKDLTVPRKEEHTVAAENYSTALTNTTARIHDLTSRFQDTTIPSLNSNLEHLHKLLETFMDATTSHSDTAAAFAAEVTSQRSLEVRRVLDQVDRVARVRRRRLRWLRRIGFAAVEWAILGFMWLIWAIVVIIRAGLTIVGGIGKSVRWFLWLD